jgi:hypothetical protein
MHKHHRGLHDDDFFLEGTSVSTDPLPVSTLMVLLEHVTSRIQGRQDRRSHDAREKKASVISELFVGA